MAADPFNSVGGYTVGIPPIPVITGNGNITANGVSANVLTVSANATITGNVTANYLIGTLVGNITGNILAPGSNTEVMFNSTGEFAGSPNLTFDSSINLFTVDGDLVANTFTMGSGELEFSTSSIVFAMTVSSSANQVLHRTPAGTICSIDYTVIATDIEGNNRQTSKLFASVLGDEVGYYEYGSIDVPQEGPGVGDFRVQYDIANNDVTLTVTPVPSTQVNYKIMTTSYKV